MPGLNIVLEILVLWAAVVAACALVFLAVRSRRIEREHGLSRSRYSLVAALGMCVIIILVAISGTATALRSGSPTKQTVRKGSDSDTSKKNTPLVKGGATAEQLAALEKKQKELQEELDRVRKQIEEAKGTDDKKSNKETSEAEADEKAGERSESAGVPGWLLVVAIVAVFVGVVLLFMLADPEVLVRFLLLGGWRNKGELRLKARANLDRLTSAADRGDFQFGLTCANATDSHLLDRFERMDWLFLRAYCAVQYALGEVSEIERKTHLEEAVRGLTTLLEEAPNHAEGAYLLATAEGSLGNSGAALARFTQAEKELRGSNLPFAENKSVCMLRLAEDKLTTGDAAESERLFDQVTRLKVLADRIPTTQVRVRLLNVRRAIQAARYAEAAEGIEAVRNLEGLGTDLQQNVAVVCDAFQTLVSVRRGDENLVLKQIDEFLAKHLPSGLPKPDEAVADEYLEAPIGGVDLRIEPRVFGAFLFLKAAALARLVAKTGKPPTATQTSDITKALLIALQFELRQRDALAALGGVYYWFIPEKRKKALGWMKSAVSLGADSRVVRRILERDQRIEAENKEALEWFREATGRFLHDPTVSTHVRQALVEELGRFQGFQPLLLELDRQIELDPQEPTVRLLRERAEYMQKVVADFATRKSAAVQGEFDQLREEYARLLAALEESSGRMADIERRFVQEVGNSVLS